MNGWCLILVFLSSMVYCKVIESGGEGGNFVMVMCHASRVFLPFNQFL